MSLLARSLRFIASVSSAGDSVRARDTWVPSAGSRPRATSVTRERLASLTSLPRDPSPAHGGLARAADRMVELLTQAGAEVWRDRFRVVGGTAENVVARLAGGAGPPVLVIAHYDAVPGSPGADDNASGAIGLVEIAERLRDRPRRAPVWLVATTHEECGMDGSVRLARSLRGGTGVRAVVDLEMIAYTSAGQGLPRGVTARRRGDFVAVVANEPSAFIGRAMLQAARRMQIDLPVELVVLAGRGDDLPISRLSDHAPFWDLDLPAVMVTDTAFLRNPNYHAASDTVETLDLDFMLRVCELCVETVVDLSA